MATQDGSSTARARTRLLPASCILTSGVFICLEKLSFGAQNLLKTSPPRFPLT